MKILVIAAMLLAAGAGLNSQAPAFAPNGTAGRNANSIDAARELYASARYDEALALLNGLGASGSSSPAERKLIEQYRSLCLLALGRADEAGAAIAAVVRVDPFYQPSEAEASPRVRATFADVRQRLLPDLASARYVEAKQAYDRKSFGEASVRFRELLALLDDPQMGGRLSDLRTLTAGFVELATSAAAPPPVKEKEIETAPPPASVEPKKSAAPKIYTAEDEGIVPPVIIHQDVPQVPAAIVGMTRDKGVLDLVIDEQGRVVNIVLRSRVHPMYDSVLMTAAREWKYKPAQLNGTPVKYRKLLQISIKR
jgi:hypothetical protein